MRRTTASPSILNSPGKCHEPQAHGPTFISHSTLRYLLARKGGQCLGQGSRSTSPAFLGFQKFAHFHFLSSGRATHSLRASTSGFISLRPSTFVAQRASVPAAAVPELSNVQQRAFLNHPLPR